MRNRKIRTKLSHAKPNSGFHIAQVVLTSDGMFSDVTEQGKEEHNKLVIVREWEPCSHIGCLQHITHPCEVCHRVGGKGVYITDERAGNGKDSSTIKSKGKINVEM